MVPKLALPPERPAPKPTRIVLIRHAQSGQNDQGVIQGQSDDTGLTEQGRREAGLTAAVIADLLIDMVYCSPARRAKETAAILFPGREVIELPELWERNFGIWQGLTFDAVRQRWPAEHAVFDQTREILVPGAERLREYQERCSKLAERLVLDHPGKTVALVTHAGIVRGVTAFVAGRRKVLKAETRNCGITILEYDRLLKSFSVVQFDEAGHLR